MKNLKALLLVAAVIAISACQTMPYQPYARDVKKKPQTSGIIALKLEHREEDKAKAADMMKANCGANPFKIVEEGEMVVGQTTTSTASETQGYGNKKQVGTFLGMPVTSGTDASRDTNTNATTTAVKEWQISYECEVAKATEPEKAKSKKKSM